MRVLGLGSLTTQVEHTQGSVVELLGGVGRVALWKSHKVAHMSASPVPPWTITVYLANGICRNNLTVHPSPAPRYPFTSNVYVSHVDLDDVAAATCGLLATPGAAGR